MDNSYALAMYMQLTQCLGSNKGTGGEYLRLIMIPCQSKVSMAFEKFMEEQMRNIEEIKLDGKKRVVSERNSKAF